MELFNFRCALRFRTPYSVGYELTEEGALDVFPSLTAHHVIGRVDMHWNADTHIKIYVTICLNAKFAASISHEMLRASTEQLIESLGLPKCSTFEALLFPVNNRGTLIVDKHVDGNRVTDIVGS